MAGFPLLDLFSGFATAKAQAAQAQQARIDGQIALTRGVEAGEQAKQQLRQTLGNIDTIQNARGIDVDSPSAQAVTAKTIQDSDRNEAITRLGALSQAQGYATQAFGYQTASNWAIPLAIGQATNDAVAGYTAFMGPGG